MRKVILFAAIALAAASASAQSEDWALKAKSIGLSASVGGSTSGFGIRYYLTDSLHADPFVYADYLKSDTQATYIGEVGIGLAVEKAVFPSLLLGVGGSADFRYDYSMSNSGANESTTLDLSAGPTLGIQYLVAARVGLFFDYSLLVKWERTHDIVAGKTGDRLSLDTQTAALGIAFYL
jgi:hypothetical protein